MLDGTERICPSSNPKKFGRGNEVDAREGVAENLLDDLHNVDALAALFRITQLLHSRRLSRD